nr:MAG TPA: hypothetical protein [Caudoviricetes sp.]
MRDLIIIAYQIIKGNLQIVGCLFCVQKRRISK